LLQGRRDRDPHRFSKPASTMSGRCSRATC
jgi:hypothetical protein